MAATQYTMKPWRVQICSDGCGGIIEKMVFAKTAKEALKEVVEHTPHDHECWQWAGWRVQVFEEYRSFIVSTLQ